MLTQRQRNFFGIFVCVVGVLSLLALMGCDKETTVNNCYKTIASVAVMRDNNMKAFADAYKAPSNCAKWDDAIGDCSTEPTKITRGTKVAVDRASDLVRDSGLLAYKALETYRNAPDDNQSAKSALYFAMKTLQDNADILVGLVMRIAGSGNTTQYIRAEVR